MRYLDIRGAGLGGYVGVNFFFLISNSSCLSTFCFPTRYTLDVSPIQASQKISSYFRSSCFQLDVVFHGWNSGQGLPRRRVKSSERGRRVRDI